MKGIDLGGSIPDGNTERQTHHARRNEWGEKHEPRTKHHMCYEQKVLPMKTVIAALSPSQAIIPDIVKMDTISTENLVNAVPSQLPRLRQLTSLAV